MKKATKKIGKRRLGTRNSTLIREEALMLCGAAATGDAASVRRLKTHLTTRPLIAKFVKEFTASKSLQASYEHSKCLECFKLIRKKDLVDHLQTHDRKIKMKPKATKSRANRGPSVKSWKDLVRTKGKRKKAEASKKKKAICISDIWIKIYSTRATGITSGNVACSSCKRKRAENTKYWRYADTSEGPLVLCMECKTKAINGGKKPKPKPARKHGGDAMSRAVSGGGFDTNRRRH
jgi:hypothetical protein